MQIQFDPNQEYQRDAVNAVLDLFEGQSKSEAHFSVVREFSLGTQLSGLIRTERTGQPVDIDRAKAARELPGHSGTERH